MGDRLTSDQIIYEKNNVYMRRCTTVATHAPRLHSTHTTLSRRMLSINPKYTLATPVVVLQDYLAGITQERFKAYTIEWIKRYPNKTAAQLSKSPRFMLTFLDDSMVVLNLLSQHPELLHNVEFQTKYGFIEQEIDNLRTSIKKRLDLSVLLKECQVTMDLMSKVCKGLEDLDPCVALMQEEEMSGGGEAVVTDTISTDA